MPVPIRVAVGVVDQPPGTARSGRSFVLDVGDEHVVGLTTAFGPKMELSGSAVVGAVVPGQGALISGDYWVGAHE